MILKTSIINLVKLLITWVYKKIQNEHQNNIEFNISQPYSKIIETESLKYVSNDIHNFQRGPLKSLLKLYKSYFLSTKVYNKHVLLFSSLLIGEH